MTPEEKKELVEIVELRQAVIGGMMSHIASLEKYRQLKKQFIMQGKPLPPGLPNYTDQQAVDKINRCGKILKDARESYDVKELRKLFKEAEEV